MGGALVIYSRPLRTDHPPLFGCPRVSNARHNAAGADVRPDSGIGGIRRARLASPLFTGDNIL